MNLPTALLPLIALPHWVLWRWENDKKGKPTKVPYQASSPKRKAKSTEATTWSKFEVANAALGEADGIGFCLLNSNLAAFDIDDCRDPGTGEIDAWALELVARAKSYTEITISGTGLRIIGYGTGEKIHRKQSIGNGVTLESYRQAERYIVMTGNMLPDSVGVLENIDAVIDAVVDELDAGKKKTTVKKLNGHGPKVDIPQALGSMLFHRNEAGYASRSELFCAFVTGCLRKGIKDEVIISSVMDEQFEGCAIFDHVQDNGGIKYIERQIEKLALKTDHDPLAITIVAGGIGQAVDDTQEAILATKRAVFVRAGVLVEPIWTKYPTNGGGETTVTIFKAMAVENLSYMLNKHNVVYQKWTKPDSEGERKIIVIDPPFNILTTMIKLGYWKFPRVAGIINVPTMRPDGSILRERGYDAATQLWCWPDEKLKVPEIEEKPTKAQAEEALNVLKSLLDGFPWQKDLDRSVALAAILTTVLRGAFSIAPMFLFLAYMSGTGKSFLVDLISTIVRGRPCPVIAASRDEAEMEKRIGALLLESSPLISLDNMSFDLRSDVLCQMCTQQTVKIRILGRSEAPECEWRGTLFATGNNIRLVGDLARRGLISNLDAGVERPELRKFNSNPIELVLADQGKYVAAALTVARAYFVAGEGVTCDAIGSYEKWSRFVREPLIWLGEPDPIASMEQAHHDDPNREAADRLVAQWNEHLGTEKSYKVNEIIEEAKRHEVNEVMGAGIPCSLPVHPDFFAVLVERAGERGQIDHRKVGFWLRSLKGQIHNGFKVIVAQESASNGNRWKLQKVQV